MIDELTTYYNESTVRINQLSYTEKIALLAEFIGSESALHRDELIMLFMHSEGSSYENTREILFEIVINHIITKISEYNKDAVVPLHEVLARPIACSFFEGLFQLLVNEKKVDELKSMVIEYCTVYFNGCKNII